MYVYVGSAAGNAGNGEAGRGCQDPGLAKLNYSVLFARGQADFYVQSQDCSGVSVSVRIIVRFLLAVSSSGGNASE